MALTALQEYDNYTFTHMVNVSILTMGQARALSIDGALLREFGFAALMHDIGKVQTPLEVLNKPDKLTNDEFDIMKRHVVDGADILRRTPEMPALAPVVAFEHHLRIDGTGYPVGVHALVAEPRHDAVQHRGRLRRDAIASARYQQSFPTDRILEVMKRNDGQQFDHTWCGGSRSWLASTRGQPGSPGYGRVAVVIKIYAPDPHRPQVRVSSNRLGLRSSRRLYRCQPVAERSTTWTAALDRDADRPGRPQ